MGGGDNGKWGETFIRNFKISSFTIYNSKY